MIFRITRRTVGASLLAALLAASLPAWSATASPQEYQRLAKMVGRNDLRGHVEYLAGLGSRLTGTPGCEQAAAYIKKHFRSLGLRVESERYPITIPVTQGAAPSLTLPATGLTAPIYPLWPNSVRTCKLPPAGLTGPLVWGGAGELSDLDGKPLAGSIALLDFRCGSRWLNVARLGAKAILFMEPEEPVIRGEAESKYVSVPANIPRFWVPRATAIRLLARLETNPETQVHLRADVVWRKAQAENIVATIPGRDPKLRRQTVYISAYYDSMSIVPQLAPGAESACGIAAMLELAKVFAHNPPKRTVTFLATSGHFEAMQGMRAYLGRHLTELETGTWHHRPAKFLGLIPYRHDYRVRKLIHLMSTLDLSSRTSRVGIFYKGWYYDYREDIQRDFSGLGRAFRENGDKIAPALGRTAEDSCADGINPISGKPWRTFIPGKVALECEPYTLGGGQGVSFVTTDDTRSLVDTPFDLPEYVDFRNLEAQVDFLACSYFEFLNDPLAPLDEEPSFHKMTLNGGFGILSGRAVIFDPTKGLMPDTVVPGSLVTMRPGEGAQSVGKVIKQAYMGVRADVPQLVDDEGNFAFLGVPTVNAYGYKKGVFMDAYHLDPETGEIDYAPDLGESGNKAFAMEVVMTMGKKEATLVMFQCASLTIFDIVDPVNLLTLPDINVYNGNTDAVPRSFGYAISRPERWVSHVSDVGLIFAEPGANVKVTMGLGPGAPRLLLLNSTAKDPDGTGFVARGNRVVANTALQVAKDMWLLDDSRIAKLAKYRIINQNINNLHKEAAARIKTAEAALRCYDYSTFDGAARAAWGFESRAYPEVQTTTDDVVKGVLFYLALMLPFAFFLERLVFAFPDLKMQIVGTVGIFSAIFAIFRYIHPAFDITMNPLVILLAFIMLALALLVISLVVSKFEQRLKAIQTQMSGVHKADIGRMSVAFAAFSLGISNMRKRRARTLLTCITLVLLTFTVLSFTSVVQETRFNDRYSPGIPRYNGLMVRNAVWWPLEESAFRLLNDEFGGRPVPEGVQRPQDMKGKGRAVVGRAWYSPSLEGADEQSFIRLTCSKSEKFYNVRSAVGLSPEERYVTHPQDALRWGRWFNRGERYACIIPSAVAQTFGIKPEDIGRTQVQFAGMSLNLVGVLDTDKFRRVTDLDKEPLTPVDFIQMAKLQRSGQQQGAQGFQEYIHFSPDDCILIPYDLSLNMGAQLRSVAIDFVTRREVQNVLKDLMPRLGYNIYAGRMGVGPHHQGEIRRYSSISATSITGLSDLIFPILIAALIVLNTMLGSVYERVREIGIFSSIGLAPNHIGLLFLAEAFVFAILGAIFGYLIGQGTAKIITILNLLPGLYLNYSSLSAVASTTVVIATVILSTLYPARKASEVATPAIERRWKVPEPEGDDWRIPLPFAVTGEQASALNAFMSEWFHAYEEYSIGDFVTQNVESADIVTEHGKGYSLRLMTWLAPFDLGVSQRTELRTEPTQMEDVFEIYLILHRESGDVSSWKRVNRRFLNTLRKQFLIWRTLAAEERERYLTGPETAAEPASA